MYQRRRVWLHALVLLVVIVVTGCSRRTPPPAPPPPAPPPVATTPAPPPPPPPPAPPAPPAQPPQQVQRPLTEDEIFAKKTVADLNTERALADVAFDYDQFAIRDDQRPILQKNAD